MISFNKSKSYKKFISQYYRQFIIEQTIAEDGVSRFWIMKRFSFFGYRPVFGPYRSLGAATREIQSIIRRMLSIKIHKRNARNSRIKINC